MQNNENFFPQTLYSEHLTTIKDINFTPREIDILSCLVSMRGTSKIASLLCIAPRTVITHIHNIMLKIECNSRDRIIDFIQKSQKLSLLRAYHSCLMNELAFEKFLKEVTRVKRKEKPPSLVVYLQNQNLINTLLHHLGKHLAQAGVRAEVREQERDYPIKKVEKENCVIFLYLEKEAPQEISQELMGFNFIDLRDQDIYYFLVFDILKNLLPTSNLESIFAKFKEHYNGMHLTIGNEYSKNQREKALEKDEKIINEFSGFYSSIQRNENFLLNNKSQSLGRQAVREYKKSSFKGNYLMGIAMSIFILGGIGSSLYFFTASQNRKNNLQINTKNETVRSELSLPHNDVFLKRPELVKQIEEKLAGDEEIQAIALVGIGGAGKTILARQYAHQQNTAVIWEINAETKGSLIASFENLAYVLAKKEEEKKILRGLEEIKDYNGKIEKLISFIKEKLKTAASWFLVYDNVEKFSDIQKYFPIDSKVWGHGKIILTTKDSNISNNNYIHHTVAIGELSEQEKLNLFVSIINHGNNNLLNFSKNKQIEDFLIKIPSFPLDVSAAAHYLSATNISYKEYLENLEKSNESFEEAQKNILKETIEYSKTRYNIITLSLKQIIDMHSDFKGLLLFVSLLDSANVPRDLLKFYNNSVVDNFIFYLKKYSLIIQEPSFSSMISAFSIHRNTQAIILSYINKNLEEREKVLHLIVDSIENYATEIIKTSHTSQIKILEAHCEKLLKQNDFAMVDKVKGIVELTLGNIYFHLGKYFLAKEILEESLKKLKKDNRDPTHITWALKSLGDTYTQLGCYQQAKELFEQNIALCTEHSMERSSQFAWALANLGVVYVHLGFYKKAKDLLTQSLELYEKEFRKNYDGIYWLFNYFGNLHYELGEYEKAKNFYQQGLLICEKSFFKDHTYMAWSLNHLGKVYKELGDYKKAKDLLAQSLTIYEKLYSLDDIHFAASLAILGDIYKELGDYKRAEDLLTQSLNIYEKVYGNNYFETAYILINLGQVYLRNNDLQAAEIFSNKALDIFQRHKSWKIYLALKNLVEIFVRQFEKSTVKKDVEMVKILNSKSIEYINYILRILKMHLPEKSPRKIAIEANIHKLKKKLGIKIVLPH